MRSRALLALAVLGTGAFLVPSVAHATAIPFFGPIVPEIIRQCAAGWGGVIQLVNNSIAFALTILILFIAPFLIAWAGFLLVVSGADPGNRAKARRILLNTVIGIVIALAAWLIVNFLLTALVAPDKGVAYWTDQMFNKGAVSCIITKTDLYKEFTQAEGQTIVTNPGLLAGGGTGELTAAQACADYGGLGDTSLEAPATTDDGVLCADGEVHSTKVAPGTALTPNQVCADVGGVYEDEDGGGATSAGPNQVRCKNGDIRDLLPAGSTGMVTLAPTGSGACDAGAVQQYAAAGGYPLTSGQAQTLACIAQPESNCGTVVKNYSWDKPNAQGKASSAAGAWQILLSSNAKYFENQTCYQAAGVSSQLNCSAGFSNGFPKTDPASQAIVNNCLKAAANVECNAVAAAGLLKANNGSFSAWTADPNGAQAQKQCIAKYAGT